MGEGRRRPASTVVEGEESEPADRLQAISAASLAVLAIIAAGAALFTMRDFLLPIVTAFVVGVMLSPIIKALEARRVPRVVSAALIVVATAMLIVSVVALIAAPVAEIAGRLPEIGAKLREFDGAMTFLHRLEKSVGLNPSAAEASLPAPSLSWLTMTIGFVSPPLTGLLYFLVVLLLFLSWWPDLRRQLVMTFASRDSRLTVLKSSTRPRRCSRHISSLSPASISASASRRL